MTSKMASSDRLKNYRVKPCFYRHLGLCPGVCTGEISRRRYLAIIKKLERFLAGDFGGLKAKLEKEMRAAAKKQKFEMAAEARDAAETLGSLTLAGEQEEETAVSARERVKAVIKLFKFRASATAFRIEGFDVSNLGGRLAAAAMVVFIGGIKDTREYRHFRIKSLRATPTSRRGSAAISSGLPRRYAPRNDDAAGDPRMIAEAVERRMLHPEWGKPDLIVIDGGGPQLRRIRKDILYLGLAKNPDRLVIPSGNGFKTIRVSARDLGFQLLQQVRDEAHRFSRRLHLKLRKKMLIE